MHSLASNRLGETDSVKNSDVSGGSLEVGSLVTYQGRQMTVSCIRAEQGMLDLRDMQGLLQLASALGKTKLQSLKFVAPAK